METLLKRLASFVAANPTRAFFAPPAHVSEIDTVERATGFTLPTSYRRFLGAFNGGFINIGPFGPADPHWNLKSARWNSNYLFGTDDLIKEYDRMRRFGGWESIPFLPFCQTDFQEWLVFPTTAGDEPPVLDAWLEASEWKPLFSDFPTLVRAYLDGEGRIRTIASP